MRLCVMMYKYQMQQSKVFCAQASVYSFEMGMLEVWKLMCEAGVYFVEI